MEVIRGKIQGPKKVVVYGPEGIGKSTFASKFPDPLFIDPEESTKELDVARTPKPTSWTMLITQIKAVRDNPSLCKTLAVDTADWSEILCSRHVCAKADVDSIEAFGYGKGYIRLEEEFGRALDLLTEVIGRGINVVVNAHAQMRKFDQPDEMGSYDRWELKLEKKTAALLKEWADVILFANYETHVVNVDNQGVQKGKNKVQGGKRVMYTTHHPCWDAKNRYGLADKLNFDYAEIAHLFAPTTSSAPAPDPTPPPVEKPAAPTPTPPPQKTQDELCPAPPRVTVPKPLADLMRANNVTEEEIQKAVAKRGYYPVDTPIGNYALDFIDGVLVADWDGVFRMIQKIRDGVPF